MRQYTTPEQTAKLIEMGFRPKARIKEVQVVHLKINVVHDCSFTIGELIEMLPQVIEFGENVLFYPLHVKPTVGGGWAITYCNKYDERNNELIDALYDMIVKLKEEGVI